MSGRSIFTLKVAKGSQIITNQNIVDSTSIGLRVAIPGIITAFDEATQTVSVQPAIMENVKDDENNITLTKLPVLLDVPLVMPRSGGYSLTMPISIGDECLVIFADMCINSWWSSGGVQNQEEVRRHDLSDAFAILGTWSQVKKPATFSTTKACLKHEASGNGVEVSSTGVNLIGATKINGMALDAYIESFIPA
jgi:hypothetical protein